MTESVKQCSEERMGPEKRKSILKPQWCIPVSRKSFPTSYRGKLSMTISVSLKGFKVSDWITYM